ncbi:MAG: efflux RND transporter permease subunit [Planctomycetia bacterium]|nr:efflux RND transporter permease subunit [Planctomycetia bacterium]
MNISEICIRRPIFTWVLVAVPVVLGVVAYFGLGVDLFPKVDFPVVSVTAALPGASAEEMETTVTKPIEEAINQVSGLDELRSTTREGVATVIVQFKLEKNGDVAAQEVRDKLAAISRQLPQGMEPPIVDKFDLDAAPIMTIGIAGNRDLREVTEIAKHQIQEQLQTVPGVGMVSLSGGRNRAINVVVDTDKLTAYGLSVEDVRQALVSQNLEVPGGIVHQGARELVLRTLGRVATPAQFNDLVVSSRQGYPIRIRDIGRAEDSVEEPRGLSRLDGQNAVCLFVQRQSGTNTVAISDAVRDRLASIGPALPPDIKIELIQDQSRFIRESMHEVKFHLLLAAVLVAGTIMLFIRDWRTTVIATLAIPTSIVPTFLFMQYMGFTLNNITMLGLILAIGIVIDDAVVVHENIFRHMEEFGKDAFTAARDGTREIALAVLATSLSLVVIFVPIAFMGGMVGRFFSSFGLTIAFAVVMSLFVSFTLTPMLCAHFLKLEPDAGHANSKAGWIYRLTDWVYGKALRGALRWRLVTMIVCVLVVLSTGPIGAKLGVNLVPRDDQSEFQVFFITPEGYTLETTDKLIGEIEQRLAALPGVVHRFTSIGENTNAGKGQGDVTRGSIYFRMKELEERGYTQFEVMKRARAILQEYPDLRTAVSDVSAIGGGDRGDSRIFQVTIQGPDIDKLSAFADTMKTRLRQVPGLADVDSTLSLRKPEVQVAIDRDRAGDLGIPVQTVANSLSVLVGGQIVSRYKEGTELYDVWLRADQPFRANPQSLEQLTVPSPTAGPVHLASLAKLTEARGPSQIDRLSRQRTVTLLAHPDEISLNEAMQRAQDIARDMNLPPGYEILFGGQAKMLGETGYYALVALGLSVLFMYLILAAQFESWLHPISILAALPVTIPFGLLSLLLFRTPMDLYAMFGLFMLIGIVKKNGILQVDKTNELRRAGLERDAAILEANHTRLRPILMTTVMLIAAMVPIALGQGPGAGARASMAKVIIGGQMLSLLLALLVTPVTYSLFDSIGNLFGRLRRGREPATQHAATCEPAACVRG